MNTPKCIKVLSIKSTSSLFWPFNQTFPFSLSPTLLSVQVFRTDFITAMKLPDSAQLGPDDFYVLSDPWRQEWEKGVQVPANLEAIPEPVVR